MYCSYSCSCNFEESKRYSSTLVAFCGSPGVSAIISNKKAALDLILAVTGKSRYTLNYVSESYGGPKSQPKKGKETDASHNIKADTKQKDYRIFDDSAASLSTMRKDFVLVRNYSQGLLAAVNEDDDEDDLNDMDYSYRSVDDVDLRDFHRSAEESIDLEPCDLGALDLPEYSDSGSCVEETI